MNPAVDDQQALPADDDGAQPIVTAQPSSSPTATPPASPPLKQLTIKDLKARKQRLQDMIRQIELVQEGPVLPKKSSFRRTKSENDTALDSPRRVAFDLTNTSSISYPDDKEGSSVPGVSYVSEEETVEDDEESSYWEEEIIEDSDGEEIRKDLWDYKGDDDEYHKEDNCSITEGTEDSTSCNSESFLNDSSSSLASTYRKTRQSLSSPARRPSSGSLTLSPTPSNKSLPIPSKIAVAQTLPSPSESYPTVSLSFLAQNLQPHVAVSVFAEAFRILTPGGTLFVFDIRGQAVAMLPEQYRDILVRVPYAGVKQTVHEIQTQQIMQDNGYVDRFPRETEIVRWMATKDFD